MLKFCTNRLKIEQNCRTLLLINDTNPLLLVATSYKLNIIVDKL